MNAQKPKILIVEPLLDGHHAFYLSLIIKALLENQITLLTCQDTSHLKEHFDRQAIDQELLEIVNTTSVKPAHVYLQACKLTHDRAFDKVFIPYFDHYLPLILANSHRLNAPVSGIWFHPYALDAFYRWMPPIDKRNRERGQINRRLRVAERTEGLEHIFFLDPKAHHKLKAINPLIASTILPDPGECSPRHTQIEARESLGLPRNKIIFLHAGSPEKRKGLPDVIQAFHKITHNKTVENKYFLLRIGTSARLNDKDSQKLHRFVQEGHAHISDGHVSNEDFIKYFAASDVVLIPYRNFRFSSGILANAVLAKRPVIASNYGMIGNRVQNESIGTVYKHKSVGGLIRLMKAASPTRSSGLQDIQKLPNIDIDSFVEIVHLSINNQKK
jgi:glycosyltransferase involved in cell wall biosynthesis